MISSAIQAVFGADTAPLNKSATEAEGIVGKFGSGAAAALSALGITLGAGAIMGFFKSVIDKAGALQDLSDRLEVGTDELQSFDFAVRQAGGTTEQANMIWDKARKSVDSLASGNKAAADQFAALGLTAKDFIGLNLPQSLEKIAQSYSENTNRAGAYDAVTDILGSKSAPRLNAVLLQLANEGFGKFNEAAKEAGQLMDENAVQRLDTFGDKFSELVGRLTPLAATLLNAFMRATDGLGIIAAVAVNAVEGISTGYVDLEGKTKKASKAAEDMLPALVKTSEELKAQKDLKQEQQKLDELLAKDAREQADYAGKVAEFKRQMNIHAEKAFALGTDELTREKELFKFAQLQIDLKKLETAEREKITAATRLGKDEELEYAKLSVKAVKGLTYEEGLRLDVLKLQQAELRRQYEVKEILAKGVQNLTAADRKRLGELFNQEENLKRQIGEKQNLIAATKEQGAAEEKVTAEQTKQFQMMVQRRQGQDPKDLSDRELAERISNLSKIVESDRLSRAMGGLGDLGAYFAAPDLEKAEAEQARRSQFRQLYGMIGEKAFLRYSAFDEQTLRNYIRPEDEKRSQQTLTTLQNIDARLRSAGLTTF